ncbi:CapA family protein [Butyricimonas paravirosa]|uniref:CapA family protein n=1 Tax=Butyricimonas paravirosa TaxID=1472417 RepID=UPI0022E747C8|nr:CapA family protein [Butyricimonas paravirosa]
MIDPIIKKIRAQIGEDSVSIGIIGDVSFHNISVPTLEFFEPLTKAIQKTDFVVANIETVVTNRQLDAAKSAGILLKSQPGFLKILKQLGVNVALIANNHIDDYGYQGIEDTIKYLMEEDITPFGVKGYDDIYVEKRGISFCMKGVVTPYENTDLLVPYGNQLDTINSVNVDENVHLLYFIHGFDELYSIPFPWRVKLLKKINNKLTPAALIAGHQHIYQGYSLLDDTPVCWSYGNGFIQIDYHEKVNKNSSKNCYSVLHFDKKGCYQIDEYYYYFSLNGVQKLKDADLIEVIRRVQQGVESTENDDKNEKAWISECYLNFNSNRFNRNIIVNFLYDIYRWSKLSKRFRYIHYRLMFLGYLKEKWGINFSKLWKYY